jgi:aromatic-L-amino-acid decarboxylase
LITTGASLGALHAIAAARQDRLPARHWADAVVYVTAATHYSIAKAARATGILPGHVRVVPSTSDLRMDVDAASREIRLDLSRQLQPLMIVANAGSTDTGTIDDLSAVAALADEYGLWYHVDAAYGGGYVLTDLGRGRLAGMNQADSVTFDPHKGWSLPYGTSLLFVRDVNTLRAAFSATGHYMPETSTNPHVPDFSSLSLELTREYRALRLWLPLFAYGVDDFVDHLDDKLAFAQLAYHELRSDPAFDLPWEPDLGVVSFRLHNADQDAHARLLSWLRMRGIALSRTTIRGRPALRMCICSHQTEEHHVRDALAAIHAGARKAR